MSRVLKTCVNSQPTLPAGRNSRPSVMWAEFPVQSRHCIAHERQRRREKRHDMTCCSLCTWSSRQPRAPSAHDFHLSMPIESCVDQTKRGKEKKGKNTKLPKSAPKGKARSKIVSHFYRPCRRCKDGRVCAQRHTYIHTHDRTVTTFLHVSYLLCHTQPSPAQP